MAKPKVTGLIRKVLEKYGLDIETSCWDCHGSMVIYHKACQIIAMQAGIEFAPPQIVHSDPEKGSVVIVVEGHMPIGDGIRRLWSFGEATPKNNKNTYPYAMAEKRAKDRVILGLAGIHGYLYSESEAEEFSDSAPFRAMNKVVPEKSTAKKVREEIKDQVQPEKTNSLIDWVTELNSALMSCGCEDSASADRVCVWLWDGEVGGVEECRETEDKARDTIYKMDEKRDAGILQGEFLAESEAFAGVGS